MDKGEKVIWLGFTKIQQISILCLPKLKLFKKEIIQAFYFLSLSKHNTQ